MLHSSVEIFKNIFETSKHTSQEFGGNSALFGNLETQIKCFYDILICALRKFKYCIKTNCKIVRQNNFACSKLRITFIILFNLFKKT